MVKRFRSVAELWVICCIHGALSGDRDTGCCGYGSWPCEQVTVLDIPPQQRFLLFCSPRIREVQTEATMSQRWLFFLFLQFLGFGQKGWIWYRSFQLIAVVYVNFLFDGLDLESMEGILPSPGNSGRFLSAVSAMASNVFFWWTHMIYET